MTESFAIDFSSFDKVGYHATSLHASKGIESRGLYPHKLLSSDLHDRLIAAAYATGLETSLIHSYKAWLKVNSVTFASRYEDAHKHALDGHAGGQGLVHINRAIERAKSDSRFTELASEVEGYLNVIARSNAVIYAVDLSDLGERLVEATGEQHRFRIHFPPDDMSPEVSVVGPNRLIARLAL